MTLTALKAEFARFLDELYATYPQNARPARPDIVSFEETVIGCVPGWCRHLDKSPDPMPENGLIFHVCRNLDGKTLDFLVQDRDLNVVTRSDKYPYPEETPDAVVAP